MRSAISDSAMWPVVIVLVDPAGDAGSRFFQAAIFRGPDFFFLQAAMEPFDVAVAFRVITSTVPKMTRWGWTRTAKWLKAMKALRTGGTKEALEGVVPTIEEAEHMIKASGGKVDRIEPGHAPGGVSEHTYPHINYTTAGGEKATVRVDPTQ